jgi:HAD superfamily hydrolase (TIGR01509 family)
VRAVAAVLYDLDGLAVDSEPLHLRAWERAMREMGRGFDASWMDPFFGSPVSVTAQSLAEAHDLDPARLLARREEIFLELVDRGIEPMPGLEESLDLVRAEGARSALVSSGTRTYVERVLVQLRLRGVGFEAVVTRDDVERFKPDPEPFLRAAERLRVEPRECVVLEDAPAGIAAARAAGMIAIAVPNEHTRGLELASADAVCPDLVSAVRSAFGADLRSRS